MSKQEEHMAQRYEWDFPPTMRPRRRRPPPPLEGEILEPQSEPPPRIHRVEVFHRYQPRQHSGLPPWVIALLIIAAVMWVSPFGAVVALVMLAVFVTSHPTVALSVAAALVLVVAIAVHQRWRGHPF
jgi:hypothetical protein